MGRKNYPIAGSDAGGRAAVVLDSVVGTCLRLGLEAFAYLRDTFAQLPGLGAGGVDRLHPGGPEAGPGCR